MKILLYTVKEVSEITGVTVKTLHYYHRIGLLLPQRTSESGYRLYGVGELERLQQILFYKELDFRLAEIKKVLENEAERPSILSAQKELLFLKRKRLGDLIETIEKTLEHVKKGETMDMKEMFRGFKNEDEWREAMKEQNKYLKENYGFDLEKEAIDAERMNKAAGEAITFMNAMAGFLKNGISHEDEKVRDAIGAHIVFLKENGHPTDAHGFAAQTRFFLTDAFHRDMLESQQTGLAYYLCFASEAFANG